MRRVKPHSQRRVAALFVASAAVLFTTACGGSSDEPVGTGDGGNGNGGNNAFTAYVECLSKNGATMTMPSGAPAGGPGGPPSGMPRPSGSGGPRGGGGIPGGGMGKPAGVDDATWQKAQQACASVLPSGRPGGNGRGNGAGMSPAYRNCLRDNGVTVDQGAPAAGDPALAKAAEVCQVLAPTASAAPAS